MINFGLLNQTLKKMFSIFLKGLGLDYKNAYNIGTLEIVRTEAVESY